MPIKGVSEKRRICRLGKLRLGIKAEKKDKDGNVISTYPKAVPYFVCPPEVIEVYGDQPTEIDIIFPTDSIELVASQWLKYYSKSQGLKCRGNGETAMALVDIDTGEIATKEAGRTELRSINCDPDTCAFYTTGYCKERMSLQFILPKIPGLGVYQLDTGSYWSIVNVNSSLDLIRLACGRISGIPLILALVPQEVQPEGKKKTVRVLQIKINQRITDLAQNKIFAIGDDKRLQLPPPAEPEQEDITEPTDFPEEDAPGQASPPLAEQRITALSMQALMALLGVDSTDALLAKARERWSDPGYPGLQHVNEITEASADIWIKRLQQSNVRPVTAAPAAAAAPAPANEEYRIAQRRSELIGFAIKEMGTTAYHDIVMPEIARRWPGKKGISELLMPELDEIEKFMAYQITVKQAAPAVPPPPTPAPAVPAPAAVKQAPAAATKKAAAPKTAREAPTAAAPGGSEVKTFIASLKTAGYKDKDISAILFESTGKKGGWGAADIAKAKAYVTTKGTQATGGAQPKSAEDFLKEQEG